MIDAMQPRTAPPKRGRPRRGTEMARTAALINAATRVFLREGYGLASIDKVAANYLRAQVRSGSLHLADPDRAATLFLQMICSEMHDRLLFGGEAEVATLDLKSHVDHAIGLFLLGAAPRK